MQHNDSASAIFVSDLISVVQRVGDGGLRWVMDSCLMGFTVQWGRQMKQRISSMSGRAREVKTAWVPRTQELI